MEAVEALSCPFCGFKDSNDYQMLLHVEVFHSEDGDSPFAVKDAADAASNEPSAGTPQSPRLPPLPSRDSRVGDYADCPHNCGERVPATELQSHTDFHLAEDMALEDSGIISGVELSTGACNDEHAIRDISKSFSTEISKSLRNHGSSVPKQSFTREKRVSSSLKGLFFGSPNRKRPSSQTSTSRHGKTKRLGTAELGPYAHEKRMPAWLQRMLEEGAKVTIANTIGPNGTLIRVEAIANETPDLVPVLARLSVIDRTVARAFYCSPEVHHVAKLPKEGGFCGYRNIQMLISYIRDAKATGYQHFQGRLPSIIKLQDMIEDAWDKGINTSGRLETGGIRLTRKYIGTPEAQALFLNYKIPCEAVAYSSHAGSDAYTTLIAAIIDYFEDEEIRSDHEHRVFLTEMPPIYFQHQGHSMTIVGLEVHKNGAANLVVFDPMFNPSASIKKLIGLNKFICPDPAKLMKAHRRGESYLSKYKDFEMLKIPSESTQP